MLRLVVHMAGKICYINFINNGNAPGEATANDYYDDVVLLVYVLYVYVCAEQMSKARINLNGEWNIYIAS